MKTLPFIWLILFLPVSLPADTLTTKDGKTYSSVQVISNLCDLYSVTFTHKTGTAKLLYAEMTDRDKVRYGYSPEAIAKLEADKDKQARLDQQEILRKYHEQEAAAKQREEELRLELEKKGREEAEQAKADRKKYVRLIENVPYDCGPMLRAMQKARAILKNDTLDYPTLEKKEKDITALMKPFIFHILNGNVIQILPNGMLVNCEYGPFSGYDSIVFVVDAAERETAVDGDRVTILGMQSGRYQYTATTGANRTVIKFVAIRKPDREIPEGDIKPLPEMW